MISPCHSFLPERSARRYHCGASELSGGHALQDVGHVEEDAADEVVLGHVLVLDGHLQHVELQVLVGEGEGLAPHQVGILVQVLDHVICIMHVFLDF
jgi:hypothetical protein